MTSMTSPQDSKDGETPGVAASTVDDGASTIGGSTLNDTSSLAPLTNPSDPAQATRKKSWTQRLFSHDKKDKGEEGGDSGKDRKKSIADSGPYIFAFGAYMMVDPR